MRRSVALRVYNRATYLDQKQAIMSEKHLCVQFITSLNTFVYLRASPERVLISKSAYEAELRVKTYIEISRDIKILIWQAMVPALPHYPWLATLLVMMSQQKCLMG